MPKMLVSLQVLIFRPVTKVDWNIRLSRIPEASFSSVFFGYLRRALYLSSRVSRCRTR
jgi:hypothetical protein